MKIIKKIILLILLMLCYSKIDANTWSEEMPKDLTNIKLETKVMYKWYKLVDKEEYAIFDYEKQNYIDMDDTIETEFSPWLEKVDYDVMYRTFESKPEPVYLDTSITNSARIVSFSKSEGTEYILTEIKAIQKSTSKNIIKELNAEVYDGVTPQDKEKLLDGNLSQDAYNTIFSSRFYLTFDDYYDINDVEVTIFVKSLTGGTKEFTVFLGQENKYDISSNHYIFYDNTSFLDNNVVEIKTSRDNTWSNYNSFKKYYTRYKDLLFKYKTQEKVYLDDYYDEKEDYIKDVETAKVFYKYEKVEPKIDTKIVYNYKDIFSEKEQEKTLIKENENETSSIVEEEIIGNITSKLAYTTFEEKESNNKYVLFMLLGILFFMILTVVIKVYVGKRRLN